MTHEIYFGRGDARKSQDYGMTARLCYDHHQHHKTGVHHNRSFDLQLKLEYMQKFNEMYPDENFRSIFKTAWLQDIKED